MHPAFTALGLESADLVTHPIVKTALVFACFESLFSSIFVFTIKLEDREFDQTHLFFVEPFIFAN